MKKLLLFLYGLLPFTVWCQTISVDGQTYSPQELIEDILIDSNCISNVVVTNVVSGNFNSAERSYGYFDAGSSDFPFQNGIVLSTGRLSNVEGPNDSLSDDDAPGWPGDIDLENALNESNTTNATILEFDFTSQATQISFRYLFASEEYQENNSNTCQYSDLFGFLIRPVAETQYTNIALVPDTQTPVKVTTVHSGIPGGCPPINEFYFESWNDPAAPINFNGQTKILTATANVVPNETYHVKLVIADEQNYRYDSAVFLEAGSFQLSTDLGPNRLRSANNALCDGDSVQLDASQTNAQSFKWFQNDVELTTETNATLTVTDEGTYNVEVTLDSGCIAYGEVVIEYYQPIVVTDATLTECDQNQDGITFYDLTDANAILTNNDNTLSVVDFFLTESNANQNVNDIPNPTNYLNTTPNQTVFARIENQAGCYEVAELQLSISTNVVNIPAFSVCDDAPTDGFSEFNLNDITASFQTQIPADAVASYYLTEADAFNNANALSSPYQNTTQDIETLFVKITSNNQCYAISTVQLQVLYTPLLEADETVYYCESSFPDTLRLYGGVLNDAPNNYYYEWLLNGASTGLNTSFVDINETGSYTVIVTDPNGCSASRIITVLPTEIPVIENIHIDVTTRTVTVQTSGTGLFEFALDDNTLFQDSNVFVNVTPGFHTVYVRNSNGCDVVEQDIAVLGFPKYFTPNGDLHHPTWHAYGTNEDFNQGLNISIFNRHGKLLTHITYQTAGWDGTYNDQPMPSDDYWYVATLPDGSSYRGHFALVR